MTTKTKTKKNTSIETFIDSIETGKHTELFSKVSNLTPQEQALTMLINNEIAPWVNRSMGLTTADIKIIPTIVTIQSHGVRRNCTGHYLQDAYTDKVTHESYAEIQISAEHLSRSGGETLTTAVHETVHLCCAQHYGFTLDKKDRDCTLDAKHTVVFKNACESLLINGKPALTVTKGTKGWNQTEATPELLAWFDTLDIDPDLFNIFRNTQVSKPKANRNVKYACECTEPKRSFHATTNPEAYCNACDTDFIAIS